MNRARSGDIIVRDLTAEDANAEIATGIAIVQRDAYRGRFPFADPILLEEEFVANPFDPVHTRQTINNLLYGPENGYHWVGALHQELGYSAVLGFALAYANDYEVGLLELHTHPNAQRMGVGSAMAATAIRSALLREQFHASGLTTPVALYVARQYRNDGTEHPAAWYRSIGFHHAGEGVAASIGGRRLPTERMVGSAGSILSALDRRLGFN